MKHSFSTFSFFDATGSSQVDSFSSLWGEANEVVSPASCRGRVVAHVVKVLVLDLFVNYRYCAATRRMVKSPVELKVTLTHSSPVYLLEDLFFFFF